MSQQKQQSQETPSVLRCPPCRGPPPSLVSCSAPCPPCAGGCDSGSQRPRDQSLASSWRARRAPRKPRCLSGGTTYHIKEEEC
ncbi:late cornified envelope protein 6A [Hippopotamus amphibius kiboko]|uniref:late cornified envelope protein 6A n=1 Tax=Hippopotamus amphibius kiboko TaxID=575201 RepID=UPI0025986A14|nr:late cornified envelope protein 6A [Hippopotamus amphibius kiboko]